jgi:glutamate synthase domain-containing protein 3
MRVDAKDLGFKEINEILRSGEKEYTVTGCMGQRFIAAGMSGIKLTLEGTPGNALGAYLNGAEITVEGSAQDAVGDTMNEGLIVVRGSIGDAAGYAMRGGRIFVRDDAGYRAGIHMKAYMDKVPLLVIGGRAGSFLGEYQAGGTIVVLGLTGGPRRIVGNFPCTGMHGGKMILRVRPEEIDFPGQVTARRASGEDLEEIAGYVDGYCRFFGKEKDEIMNADFTVVTPDSANPYKRLYVAN